MRGQFFLDKVLIVFGKFCTFAPGSSFPKRETFFDFGIEKFSKTDNFLKVQNKKVSQNGKLFVREGPKH